MTWLIDYEWLRWCECMGIPASRRNKEIVLSAVAAATDAGYSGA